MSDYEVTICTWRILLVLCLSAPWLKQLYLLGYNGSSEWERSAHYLNNSVDFSDATRIVWERYSRIYTNTLIESLGYTVWISAWEECGQRGHKWLSKWLTASTIAFWITRSQLDEPTLSRAVVITRSQHLEAEVRLCLFARVIYTGWDLHSATRVSLAGEHTHFSISGPILGRSRGIFEAKCVCVCVYKVYNSNNAHVVVVVCTLVVMGKSKRKLNWFAEDISA